MLLRPMSIVDVHYSLYYLPDAQALYIHAGVIVCHLVPVLTGCSSCGGVTVLDNMSACIQITSYSCIFTLELGSLCYLGRLFTTPDCSCTF